MNACDYAWKDQIILIITAVISTALTVSCWHSILLLIVTLLHQSAQNTINCLKTNCFTPEGQSWIHKTRRRHPLRQMNVVQGKMLVCLLQQMNAVQGEMLVCPFVTSLWCAGEMLLVHACCLPACTCGGTWWWSTLWRGCSLSPTVS